jgi:hypothetical protein
MRHTFNFLGSYVLTPSALFLNIAEWLKQLTINQGFTIVISTFVVIFWAFKARKQFLESQIAKRQLEEMED